MNREQNDRMDNVGEDRRPSLIKTMIDHHQCFFFLIKIKKGVRKYMNVIHHQK